VWRVSRYDNSLFEGIAARWAKLDPEGLLEEMLRWPNDGIQLALGKHLGKALVEAGVEPALERIDRLSGAQKLRVGREILAAAAKMDPERVAEFLRLNPVFQKQSQVASVVAAELARVDPEKAFEWVSAIPVRTVREQAERNAWRGWAETEPSIVAAKLEGNEKMRSELLGVIGQNWMRSDPAGAIRWMNGLTNRNEVYRALESIEFDVDELGIDRARELIGDAKDTNLRNRLLQRATHDLARKDVQEALRFLNGFEGGNSAPGALWAIVNQWVSEDAGGATKYVLALPESSEKGQLLEAAIGIWGTGEMENVTAFVQQMPAGKDRDAAMAQVVQMLSESDPRSGIHYLRSIEDPDSAGRAARSLLGAMVRTDAKEAAALAEQLPEKARAAGYAGLVGNWVEEDPHAAGQWINSLKPGDGRDSAIQAYVRNVNEKDPKTAIQWAFSIDDPKSRTEMTMSAFQRLIHEDRSAAAAWLEQADVGEGLRPFFEHELKEAERNKAFE
jgi:hypothetical protein